MAIVEALALASAVTKIAGSISSAVKAGRDMNAVLPQFGKLAKLEADINLAESGKHNGFLGRLTSTEADAFEIASAKMAHRQAQADLQSVCRLYGPSGMWDLVVREQAAARVRRRKALEEQAAARDKMFVILSSLLGVVLFIAGAGALFYGASLVSEL